MTNGVGEAADAALGGAPGQVRRQQHRSVEAGPEPLRQQVIGPSRGLGGRVVALVGDPQADREHRNGDGYQDGEAQAGHEPRPLLDLAAPAEGHRLAVVAALVLLCGQLAAGEAHDGRHEGDRREHRHEHGEDGADRQAVDEVDAHHEHAEQRDDHSAAREEHRPAGGGEREHVGVLGVEPVM